MLFVKLFISVSLFFLFASIILVFMVVFYDCKPPKWLERIISFVVTPTIWLILVWVLIVFGSCIYLVWR